MAINVQDKGIVLIIGCGHPTIQRIVQRAQQVLNRPIYGVLGGLHYPVTGLPVQRFLGTNNWPWDPVNKNDVSASIEFLQRLHPRLVALSPHDSCGWTLEAFRQAFSEAYQDLWLAKKSSCEEDQAMSWKDLEESNPEMAAFGIERFKSRVAYLATTRRDGSPRVHPVTPIIGQGHLFVFMEPTSPKGHDLQRDGRYAMHSAVSDANGTNGEFLISGRAQLVTNAGLRELAIQLGHSTHADRYILFELSVESASSTVYRDDVPIRETWKKQN